VWWIEVWGEKGRVTCLFCIHGGWLCFSGSCDCRELSVSRYGIPRFPHDQVFLLWLFFLDSMLVQWGYVVMPVIVVLGFWLTMAVAIDCPHILQARLKAIELPRELGCKVLCHP
jgi:hypothetical protein